MNNSIILGNNISDSNTTTSDISATTSTDNNWSRGDIMTLVFGLFTVVFTIPVLYFAWIGYLKEKLKEQIKSKDRRKVEEIERAKEVNKRANKI